MQGAAAGACGSLHYVSGSTEVKVEGQAARGKHPQGSCGCSTRVHAINSTSPYLVATALFLKLEWDGR